MYRRLLKKAIGVGSSDVTYLITERSRVYIIPGRQPANVSYCPKDNATYIEVPAKDKMYDWAKKDTQLQYNP
jgi:hypothetical protein